MKMEVYAIAGKLLVAPNGVIAPIHAHGKVNVAQRLKSWLERDSQTNVKAVALKEVDESISNSIFRGLQERLDAVNAQSIGFNYTGGTKAMSVHAYRAMEQWTNEQRNSGKRVHTVFSYLDARALEMVFDTPDVVSGE